MTENSCSYNGNTYCDRAGLHTWTSALPWQLALRVKHLQVSMLTQAECHWQQGLAHKDQYRQSHFEENCLVLLLTLVSGLNLLSCDLPDNMSAEISIEMGARLDFNAVFELTSVEFCHK